MQRLIDQPDISSKSTTGGEAVTINDKGDQLHVGKSFSTFADFQRALNEFKKRGNHPFRVFNSQTGKNYNLKRVGRKYSRNPVDISKFEFT